MKAIKSFNELIQCVQSRKQHKSIAVIFPYDKPTEYAILRSLSEGISRFVLLGDKNLMPSSLLNNVNTQQIKILNIKNGEEAGRQGIQLVKEGKIDILMKGLINTDDLLKLILDKDEGLLPKGKILSHLAVMEIPTYSKLLFFSDAVVIPRPSILQRMKIIEYAIKACYHFGIKQPKVSLIHFTEKVSPKFPISVDYINIVEQAEAGVFGNVIIDGPLDVKTSCEYTSGEIKGISSPINGQADVLIFPNIESGNTFYKSVSLFANAKIAGVLQGTCCPVVLPSRSDTGVSKYYSIAMAYLISENKK